MEEVTQAPEDANLRDEGTPCPAAEEAVDGCMVVKVEVNGGVATKGCKGQRLQCTK